jgi:hypothetical protein
MRIIYLSLGIASVFLLILDGRFGRLGMIWLFTIAFNFGLGLSGGKSSAYGSQPEPEDRGTMSRCRGAPVNGDARREPPSR